MNTRIIIIAIITAASLLGCTESYIDGYDISPNDPSKVLMSNLLSASQVAVIGNVTGELARTSSVWMQSQAGISNQTADEIARYKANEGDNSNDWSSIYTDWLETSNNLVSQAGDENPYYKALGLILQAWGGAYASDLWGDVPFTSAMQGLDDFNPSYDSQADIYSEAQNQLNQAITLLMLPEDDNVVLPASDDLFYEGDMGKWSKLAWALKARYHNRTSLHHSYSADSVLHCVSKSFESSSESLLATFGTSANNANQWAAMYQQRSGYMAMGEFFINRMIAANDPRLPFYATKDKDGNYTGSPANTLLINFDASPIGPFFVGLFDEDKVPQSINLPVPMFTYEELLFLKAEAYLRKTNPISAALAYNDGVKSSVKFVTGADASEEFILAHASETNLTISLESVISGKYDALFTQVEVWNDWRRTGLPVLVPNANPAANAKGIPFRLPTPIEERLYNTNAVVVSDNYLKPWFATAL